MGVDFSHCRASWAYSGFNSFRKELCELAGMGKLDDRKGFGGSRDWLVDEDPIAPLLNHSDCDGYLTPEECAKVAPRLRELAPNLKDDYDRTMAIRLAEGMEDAAANHERLIFS